MICVFDIETIPDVGLMQRVFPEIASDSPLEICEQAMAMQKEKSGSDFLPLYLHQVVSIASVIADDYGHFIKVGNFGKNLLETTPEQQEENLIGDFLKFFNKSQPKLVSFNGRGFDLPALMLRAMRYNLNATAYYEQDNVAFNKSKWENYRQRFSERFHTDLLESLGHFGMVRHLKLDSVCAMLNIPGKYDMSGDLVYKVYYDESKSQAEKMAKIDEYCQSDVLNTYWVYLKYELLKGELTLEDYFGILEEFKQKIPQDMGYSGVFNDALQKELDNAR
ncbi:3'-5' exonuclease [Helicobacter sp. 11S02596-1]|uniref:3'-5' exonuclease n=1 Tax=Helicobacter sp. 11S02596-1 TaxID=1476194 RepID=UPI000BA7E29B|nr:3'-5' exonuclease [Helicobacter sp. 11S02596-1]PAF41921.1 3'-5' exonuclease [Helicobacter sp. 11S02596-1]